MALAISLFHFSVTVYNATSVKYLTHLATQISLHFGVHVSFLAAKE